MTRNEAVQLIIGYFKEHDIPDCDESSVLVVEGLDDSDEISLLFATYHFGELEELSGKVMLDFPVKERQTIGEIADHMVKAENYVYDELMPSTSSGLF